MNKNRCCFGFQMMYIICLVICEAQFTLSQNSSCKFNDFNALYDFLNEFDGFSSNISISNCCSLHFVSCNNVNFDRRIIGLNMFNMSLEGTLSVSLSDLNQLKHLNLSHNSLHGSLPIEILHLSQLEVLDLSKNKLSGTIPLNISLSSLRVFNISRNSFDGIHPVLSGSGNLMVFDVSYNHFSGAIDTVLCSYLPQIQILQLSANKFSGNFPTGFENCQYLRELFMNQNTISGNLPDDLFDLALLTHLNLEGNNLTGPLSPKISKLSNLRMLDLSMNKFSGSIPATFGDLVNLQSFSAGTNYFNGLLPYSFSNLKNLRILDLRNNMLRGNIAVISGLQKLSSLDLGTNFFTGHIPHNISLCSELTTVNLARNLFTGEIPTSLMNLTRLSYLSLSNNSFSNLSSALRILQHCPNLAYLVLTKNFNGGEVMPLYDIEGFNKMEVLVIANCALSGMIPLWLANCINLKVLDISWNKLYGTIPPFVGTFESLFYLDISNNSLSGEIPASFTQIKSLVSTNNMKNEQALSQHFPFFAKRNSSAKPLQYNQVSSFPPSLILSNNLLVGPISPEFRNLKNLVVFDLHMNFLSGFIPEELSEMKNLENLVLSHNSLTGTIPSSLKKLNFLSIFDVSYNNLIGKVPVGGQFSTFSGSYFVGNPNLCGFNLKNSSCSSDKSSETERDQRKKTAIGTALGIGLGTFSLIIIIILTYLLMFKFKIRGKEVKIMVDADEELVEYEASTLVLLFQNKEDQSEMTVADLLKSTNNFDQSNIIGCGGFGLVFKATIPDGSKVAIKRLSGDFCQMEREFQAEVETLSRARHGNLVPLLGYCRVANDRLIIYSYMENGSLDYWLHESAEEGSILSWEKRLNAAKGAARGLTYLHEHCVPRILHRDVKSSNILLDEYFEAHLADFGLARLILPQNTHVSTDLVGTLGYIPPEYGHSSVATYKGDVYSFGVVLLELVAGRRPVDMCKPKRCRNLVQWVYELKREKREVEAFDMRVYDESLHEEMMKVLDVACLCVNESPLARPVMNQVGRWLDEI